MAVHPAQMAAAVILFAGQWNNERLCAEVMTEEGQDTGFLPSVAERKERQPFAMQSQGR